jgi:hypothetical protein
LDHLKQDGILASVLPFLDCAKDLELLDDANF